MGNHEMSGLKKLRPSKRRLIQLYSALLYNAHLRGFVSGEIYQGKAKYACVPGLNCYSCPGAACACPLGALQNALASAGHRAGWYVMGILLLFGVTLGRTICGWLCPFGLLQELLHRIPTYKLGKNRFTRALSLLKYVILAVFVIFIPLWYGLRHDIPVPGFCKYICPAGTFEGAGGLLSGPAGAELFGLLGILFTRKFIIMVIIGLACIFCYRSFCRFLCPLGAIYGLFNRFCLVGVRVDISRCSGCGACVRSCGMDVMHVGDRECIHCAKCMDSCARKAISLRAGKMVLRAPAAALGESERTRRRKNGRIACGAALAVLGFALIWFNVSDPSVRKVQAEAAATGAVIPDEPADPAPAAEGKTHDEAAGTAASDTEPADFESDAPVGKEVGMQLKDFSIRCLDGSEFRLADCRGKVTVINLWATYCAPCVKELPYFSRLYQEHEGDIAMLAVHSSLVTDDPAEYVADRDWAMPVAVDTDDDLVFDIVGGGATLPQTIVLNRRGEVIYNEVRSVTEEMLAALYEEASGD